MCFEEECRLFGLHFEPMWDQKKLKSMFRKKQVSHMHAHKTRHTHAHHAHTHDSKYAHMYTCIHCERKCHLANKFVWVRKGLTLMDQEEYG